MATAPHHRDRRDAAPGSPVWADTAELIALDGDARALDLRGGRIRALQGQNHLSPFKGRGMEFDESRPYQPGDDIRTLDWRVTARTGRAHTKLFREERERPVMVAVDLRPAMFFATRGRFKSVRAVQSAALLAWRATRQGDRLGGFLFTGAGHHEWRPGLGVATTLHFLEQLSRHSEPGTVGAAAPDPDSLPQALARLRRVARPGSLVALISDFRGLDPRGEAHLAQLARHSEVLLVFIHDPLEGELPPAGRYRLAGAGRELEIDTTASGLRRRYAQRFAEREQQLRRIARLPGVTLVSCDTREAPLACLQRGLRLHR